MKQSESIAKLTAALVKVQEHIQPVAKDRVNSHFKNRYATLDSIMESVRAPLASVGLAIVQGGGAPVSSINGDVVAVGVETMLVHESGEYVSSIITLPLAQASPQAVGSAITYGRRYGVGALLALTTEEDDDGNHAQAVTQHAAPRASGGSVPARPTSNGGASAPPVNASSPAPVGGATSAARGAASETARAGGHGDEPTCPKCDGPLWDNRIGKKNPKAPDWKCKDRSCDGVIWPPRESPNAVPFRPGDEVPHPAGLEEIPF